jgi:hypothetical protein
MSENNNNKNIDARVLELFNKVKEKQKKIAANERVSYETNCSFGYSQTTVNDRVNLQVTTDLNYLVDAYIFLQSKVNVWKDACDALGVKVSLKWLGYAPGDWIKDIKTRIGQLQLNNERKELKVMEERLDKLITMEQRREMELAAIEKELN